MRCAITNNRAERSVEPVTGEPAQLGGKTYRTMRLCHGLRERVSPHFPATVTPVTGLTRARRIV